MARAGYASGGDRLTVSIKEELNLGGVDYGCETIKNIANIKDVYKRLISVTTTETEVAAFGSTVTGGQFIVGDVRYIRITNLDDINHCILTFKDEDGCEFAIKLDKGNSFVYFGDVNGGMADVIDANQVELQFTDATVDTSSGAFTQACDASPKIKVGQKISGTGIPTGATVATVNTPGAVTSFTLSSEATATGTNITATFANIMKDLANITVQADTATVDLQIYIASK